MDRGKNEKWQACSNNKKRGSTMNLHIEYLVHLQITGMKRKKVRKKLHTRKEYEKNTLTVFSKYTHR